LDTRPTPDRLRESLFSILTPRIEGAVFADLYAGTGAVGIEALSRGARKAIFVESNRAALTVIRENLRSLNAEARAEVRQGNVAALGAMLAADIAFIDPPYHKDREYDAALNAVRAPFVIVQHDVRWKPADKYGQMGLKRTVRQGDNCLSFFEAATIEESGA
jgi:16S rRNA (guanine966-N2)-methyltransferase